jgi:hypothetical protein
MIAFLPEIYPDECFFSVCSRYHDRLAYTSGFSTSRDLFGVHRIKVALDLPTYLGAFCKLVPFRSYTIDQLIENHTLFPIYSAFISSRRAAALRRNMIDRSGGAIYGSVGCLTHRLRAQFLRFCPECVQEDRRKWGETYWHRIHNVRGAEVCPVHGALVVDSRVPISRPLSDSYVSAEKAIGNNCPPSYKPENPTYYALARGLDWLLQQRNLSCDPEVKFNRYVRLMHEKGFATYAGTIHITKLEKAFQDFSGNDLLHSLECDLNCQSTWLSRIADRKRAPTQPPFHHLLVLNFLGCSVAEFFSLPSDPIPPFGPPPWPCLNRAAKHFGKLIVTKCQITMATDGTSRALGKFACTCGFVYCRLANKMSGPIRYHRVPAYGHVWHAKFRKLRLENRGLREMALELGVGLHIVKATIKKLNEPKNQRPLKTKKIPRRIIMVCRRRWLAAKKENRTFCRSELRNVTGRKVYLILVDNDRQWYELNSPPRRKTRGKGRSINWPERDRQLATQVESAAQEFINAPGRPVRSSATAIARKLGILTVLHKRPYLLPLTETAISSVAETIEDFAIRRIAWAAESYKAEGLELRLSLLLARAAVSTKISEKPKVAAVINGLMNNPFTGRKRTSRLRIDPFSTFTREAV